MRLQRVSRPRPSPMVLIEGLLIPHNTCAHLALQSSALEKWGGGRSMKERLFWLCVWRDVPDSPRAPPSEGQHPYTCSHPQLARDSPRMQLGDRCACSGPLLFIGSSPALEPLRSCASSIRGAGTCVQPQPWCPHPPSPRRTQTRPRQPLSSDSHRCDVKAGVCLWASSPQGHVWMQEACRVGPGFGQASD